MFKYKDNKIYNIEFSCIELMPQSSTTVIKNKIDKENVLQIIAFIIDELIELLEQFYILGNYQCFDPHVGDTACQIRAIEILILSLEKHSLFFYVNRIIELKQIQSEIHKTVTNLSNIDQIPKKHISILDFFKENNILFIINENEFFLFHAYLLTKYKNETNEGLTYIDHEKICTSSELSKKFSKKISRHSQQYLAEHSCDKIIEWAKFSKKPPNFIDELNKLLLHDDDDRCVLPCFYFTDVLVSVIKKLKFPILIVSKQSNSTISHILMVFIYSERKKKFIIIKENLSSRFNSPCFVVEGITQNIYWVSPYNFIERFNNIGVEEIIMSNMAAHPQYSGERLTLYKDNPFIKQDRLIQNNNMWTMLQNMKQLALINGCCKINKSLFFIQHIFCDTIEGRINKIRENNYFDIVIFGLNNNEGEKRLPLLESVGA